MTDTILQLEIRMPGNESNQTYTFAVSELATAMLIHNMVCGKNDGREPTLWLRSENSDDEMILNNRMEFNRAVMDMKANRVMPSIMMPGPFQ